ncbi:MAG TPA: phage holin family protein, partial [Streptosporangiaceae bacterium]|nr:phage holin family protein [Streptosporangiaceae bacterium]
GEQPADHRGELPRSQRALQGQRIGHVGPLPRPAGFTPKTTCISAQPDSIIGRRVLSGCGTEGGSVGHRADPSADGRALSELTAQLGRQLAQLLRDEVALARAELFARARQLAAGGEMIAVAGILALTGWLALVAAAVAGIAVALPLWAATLIVGGFLLLIAGVLAVQGRRRLRSFTPPTLTLQGLRRDVAEVRATARPK